MCGRSSRCRRATPGSTPTGATDMWTLAHRISGARRYDLAKAKDARERSQWQRWQREHEGRRVNLMMRGLRCDPDEDPAAAVRAWLDGGLRRSAKSPWHLRQKAVILIDPKQRRGEVVWDPRQGVGAVSRGEDCLAPRPREQRSSRGL